MKVEDFLLSCWPGDLVLSPKVASLIHLGHFTEERNAGGGDLLDGGLDGRRVEFRKKLVALDFGLLLRDGAFALAGTGRLILPQCLNRAIRLDLVVPIPEYHLAPDVERVLAPGREACHLLLDYRRRGHRRDGVRGCVAIR